MDVLKTADFITNLNQYFEGGQADVIEGYYNIDASKDNMHTFKRFIVALRKIDNRVILYFVDAQCFGGRKYWKPGDVYGSSKTVNKDDAIEIFINELRGNGEKAETAYDLVIGKDSFQLVTKGGKRKYKDHYVKRSPDQVSNHFPLKEMEYRGPNPEESRSLDSEHQGGLELMYWLSKIDTSKLDTGLVLSSLNVAFDALNRFTDYPIAEYHNVRQATFGLSLVFSNLLIDEMGWEWIYVERSAFTDIGWTLVSKDRKFGIRSEDVFYEKIMVGKSIDAVEFYKEIRRVTSSLSIKEGRIVMIELPCE